MRRCEALGIADRIQPSIQKSLAAIESAKKSSHWKETRYHKLRKRIQRDIEEAEQAAAQQAPPPCLSKNRVLPPPPQQHDDNGDGNSSASGAHSSRPIAPPAPPAKQQPPPQTQPPPPQTQQPPPQQQEHEPEQQPPPLQPPPADEPEDDEKLLEAELNALSTSELRALFEWRQQTSADAELDGDMSPRIELALLAAWREEVEARRTDENVARALDEMNRARLAIGEPALRYATTQANNAVLLSLGTVVREDFESWLGQRGITQPLCEPHLDELLSDWRSSPEYESTKAERIAEKCTCTPGTERTSTLPWAEVKRRVDDGMPAVKGEGQAAYDARVRADREARGVALGEYFTDPQAFRGIHYPSCTCRYDGELATPKIAGLTCDDDGGLSGVDVLGDRINYGSRPGEWQPSGGDHVPDGWVGDGTLDRNLDADYLGMPDLTSFCTGCRTIRSGEGGLSHVEARPGGEPFRVCDHMCRRCVGSDPPEETG